MDPGFAANERRVRESFAKQRAMAELDSSLVTVERGRVALAVPFSERWTQQHGFIHGGVIGMLADTACGFAALSVMPEGHAVLTVEYKLQFLSPSIGERFVAEGRVVRPGKRLIVCLCDVFAERDGRRKQTALMTATMAVVEASGGLRD